MKRVQFAGYEIELGERMRVVRRAIDTSQRGDYGADPLGDGRYRMVPSGDVVDETERARRLGRAAP